MTRSPATLASLFFILVVLLLAGCRQQPPEVDYIARVGERYLTREQLADALSSLPYGADSSEVVRQLIEQWVQNELVYQEARRRNLREDAEVRRLLEDNERSVLISTYLNRLYEQEEAEPSPASLQAYFEQHREQFRLREPYVRMRYLVHTNPDSAREAHRLLEALDQSPNPDSAWSLIVRRFAEEPEGPLSLSASYYPESRLFSAFPSVREALSALRDGQVAPLLFDGNRYHLVQLVERIPPGTLPEIAWVESELKQRLMIESRKQMYARQVQRLRNEALARQDLEIR